MRKGQVLIFAIFLCMSINLFAQSSEREAVERVIVDSYIHGLIDGEDFEKAKEGIHEHFLIWGHRDNILTKKTRDQWISQRRERGNLPKVKYTIAYIDIEGEAASVKISMTRGEITAVDYVFLYKFEKNWRIVSSIDHVERPGR